MKKAFKILYIVSCFIFLPILSFFCFGLTDYTIKSYICTILFLCFLLFCSSKRIYQMLEVKLVAKKIIITLFALSLLVIFYITMDMQIYLGGIFK